jgi:hypothetical protein
MQQTTNFLNTAQLKKNEVHSKNSKRAKNWISKLTKGKRKPTKSATSTTKGVKVCCNLEIPTLKSCNSSDPNYLIFHWQEQKKSVCLQP